MRVNSYPEGADVTIDGKERGKTPVVVSLDAAKTHGIVITKPGFAEQQRRMSGDIGPQRIVLNIFAGVVPMALDAYTEDWYEFDTNRVYVVLEKKEGAPGVSSETEPLPDEVLALSAKELFKRGVNHYKEGEYEDAMKYFRAAHDKEGDPILLYNVAFSQSKLGRHDAALSTMAGIDDRRSMGSKTHAKLEALENANHTIVKTRDMATELSQQSKVDGGTTFVSILY